MSSLNPLGDGSSFNSASVGSNNFAKSKTSSESFHKSQFPSSTHKDVDTNPLQDDDFGNNYIIGEEEYFPVVGSGFLKKKYSEQEKSFSSRPHTDSNKNSIKELSELSRDEGPNINPKEGSSIMRRDPRALKEQLSEENGSSPKGVSVNQDQNTLIVQDDQGFQGQKNAKKQDNNEEVKNDYANEGENYANEEENFPPVGSGFLKKKYSEQDKSSISRPRTENSLIEKANDDKKQGIFQEGENDYVNEEEGFAPVGSSFLKKKYNEQDKSSISRPHTDNSLIEKADDDDQGLKSAKKQENNEEDSPDSLKPRTDRNSSYKSSARDESEFSWVGNNNFNGDGGSYLSKGGAVHFPERLDEERKPGLKRPTSTMTDQSSIMMINDKDFEEKKTKETDNMKQQLKMLYTEEDFEEVVLECLKANDGYIDKFFRQYKEKASPVATCLAALYLALGQKDMTRDIFVNRISDPDETEDTDENAGYHRAWYIMRANMKIQDKDISKARELLTQCRDIPQKYFADGQEDYMDFYATSVGRIDLQEKKYKEAENAFQDALALRLRAGNQRLISSSYNDLALLFIQKSEQAEGQFKAKNVSRAKEYLDKADKYEKEFLEAVNSDKYDLLSGLPDYKRANLKETKEKYESLTA